MIELSDKNFFWTLIVIGVLGYAAITGLMKYLRHAQSERSRREALAYVAEGAMTLEQAERLLRAAPSRSDDDESEEDEIEEAIWGVAPAGPGRWSQCLEETRKALVSHVAEGALREEEGERLGALIPLPQRRSTETVKEATARINAEQESVRELFKAVARKKMTVDAAERVWRGSRGQGTPRPERAEPLQQPKSGEAVAV